MGGIRKRFTKIIQNKSHHSVLSFCCRVVIGAPKGTYPGGLNLPDPGEPRAPNTGLVYSCPLPGTCEGVVGDTSIYIGPGININITDHVQRFSAPFFSRPLSEGRLFDQARMFSMCL